MVTLSNFDPGQYVTTPIELTVTKVRESPSSRRNAVVDIRDSEGEESRLIDWTANNVGVEWRVGHRYSVSGVGVKQGGKEHRIYLDSTNRTDVSDHGPVGQQAKLLVMGDSHIGRTEHPKDGRQIDCTGQFRKALEVGISNDVDAVVHTGDVFHDEVSRRDLTETEAALGELGERSIPFYYILGNHEATAGKRLLERFVANGSACHLTLDGINLPGGVVLHGIDYQNPADFPAVDVWRAPADGDGSHVLMLHQTLSSIREFGNLDLPKSTLERYDYVLAGDLHDSEQHDLTGVDVLYAGSTQWMSTNRNPSPPSVWVLSLGRDRSSLEQFPIA